MLYWIVHPHPYSVECPKFSPGFGRISRPNRVPGRKWTDRIAGYVGYAGTSIWRTIGRLLGQPGGMSITTSRPRHDWLSGRPDHIPSMRCCPTDAVPVTERDIAAARERLRVASLASTDQTSTPATPATRPVRPTSCPRASDRVVVELHSGSVFPDRCRSNGCIYCLALNARRRCLAITLAAPERMIRLSQVAEDETVNVYKEARRRINRTREYLKRWGRNPGEWCYTIEKNPKGTGYHAHCLQWGGFIPQPELEQACLRAYAGIPYINEIRRKGIWTSRYGLKGFGADGYGLKTFRPNGDSAEALRLNNGRLEHHSTGFYRFDGEVLGVRQMERAAITTMNANNPVAFIGMRGVDVEPVMADRALVHRLIVDVNQRSVSYFRAFR